MSFKRNTLVIYLLCKCVFIYITRTIMFNSSAVIARYLNFFLYRRTDLRKIQGSCQGIKGMSQQTTNFYISPMMIYKITPSVD